MSWEAIDIAIDAIMRQTLRSASPVEGAPETVAELAAKAFRSESCRSRSTMISCCGRSSGLACSMRSDR